MEGNAILAIPDAASGSTTAYLSTQMPHALRDLTAGYVGMEPTDLRVICSAVGGGFGGKILIEFEYTIVIAASRRLGRPLRWVQSRTENLLAMHARGHRFDVTLEATKEGELTGISVTLSLTWARTRESRSGWQDRPSARQRSEPVPVDPLRRAWHRNKHDAHGAIPRCRPARGGVAARVSDGRPGR